MEKGVANKRQGKRCVTVTLQELIQLAAPSRLLSIPASQRSSSQGGINRSRFLGRGMEFAESRLYQAGDDIRTIDWRVTARTGKPHTKLFTVEKERQVLIWGDLSPSMFFATQGIFKSVQAALMMSHLAWNASQKGNRLGGMLFDGSEHYEFKPRLGSKGVLPFLQTLSEKACFDGELKNPSANLSKDDALANFARLVTPGSLLYLVSDFSELSIHSKDLLLQLARHCDIALCFIYDPFEKELPAKGKYPIIDAARKLFLDTSDGGSIKNYEQQFMDRRSVLRSLANKRHIHFLECSTQEDCFEVLKKL